MNEVENTLAGCCIDDLSLEDFAEKRSPMDEEAELWDDSGLGAIPDSGKNTPKSPDSTSFNLS